MNQIELKLEFIKYCLLGIITKDSVLNNFFSKKIFPNQEEILQLIQTEIPPQRLEGMDQPTNSYSMIGVKRMQNLHEMLDYVRINNIDGDFVETGVWKGGATIFMKIYSDFYKLNKKVFVCDSFEGLPKPSGKFASDIGDIHHTFTNLKVSLDDVMSNFRKFNCLDENVIFIKGFFGETLPNNNKIQKISLLRMDGDMYESTHDVFHSLYDKVTEGSPIIIDDFCLKGCNDCVIDFRKEKNITAQYEKIDRCGIYWFK